MRQMLLQKVALPPIEADMDKVAVIARYRAALITANNRIEGVAQCLAEIDAPQTGNNIILTVCGIGGGTLGGGCSQCKQIAQVEHHRPEILFTLTVCVTAAAFGRTPARPSPRMGSFLIAPAAAS